MPTPPPDRSRRKLSHEQQMFLLYGPADRWNDAFADEGEVREAWNQHRARILGHYRGARPWAFWAIDHPELRYRADRERSTLWRAGAFSSEEEEELEAEWV